MCWFITICLIQSTDCPKVSTNIFCFITMYRCKEIIKIKPSFISLSNSRTLQDLQRDETLRVSIPILSLAIKFFYKRVFEEGFLAQKQSKVFERFDDTYLLPTTHLRHFSVEKWWAKNARMTWREWQLDAGTASTWTVWPDGKSIFQYLTIYKNVNLPKNIKYLPE